MRDFIANGGSLSGLVQNTVRFGRHKAARRVYSAQTIERTAHVITLPALWRCCPGRRRQRRLYLTDPTLTLQSYRVDAQKERIAMYWQDRHGKAWGSPAFAAGGIDGDGRVQMAMNGGIYDKAYAPLGLYIEDGKRLTPVNRFRRRRNFFIRPAAYSGGKRWRKSCRCRRTNLPAIRYAVQSGPMLIENGVINWRLKPPPVPRKLRNGLYR